MCNLRQSVMVKTSLEMAVEAWLRDPREVRPLEVVLAEEGLAGTACGSGGSGGDAMKLAPRCSAAARSGPGRPSVEELSVKYERLGLTG